MSATDRARARDAATPAVAPSRGAGRGTVLSLALAGLAVASSQTLVVPLLPLFPELLDTSVTAASWLLTITLLTGAVSTPVLGRLADVYGKKPLMLVALGSFVLGSVLCAVGGALPVLLVGRGLQGLSLAAIPVGISLVGDVLHPDRVGSGVGTISAMLGVGGAVGLPLGGFVVEHFDYRALFWLCTGLGLLAILLVVVVVPRSDLRWPAPTDAVGALLLTASLCGLLVPLSNGATWGWTSPRTLGPVAAAVVLLALLIRYELRRAHPLVAVRTLRRRGVLLTNAVAVAVGYSLFGNFVATAVFVQVPPGSGYGFGADLLSTGLVLLPGGAAMAILAPAAGVLMRVRGHRLTLLLGLVVSLVGWTARLWLDGSLWQVGLAATLVSAGTALVYAAMPAMVMLASPVSEAGSATGLNALARTIGSSLASAVCGAVLASVTISTAAGVFPAAAAFTLLTALGIGATVLAIALAATVRAQDLSRD